MASNKNKMHDRISNLPGHIVDQILSCLSLRDAVRTSTLSKNWRFKWVTLPSLAFTPKSDDEFLSTNLDSDQNKLVSIIDCVLLLHTGPIHEFELIPSHSAAVSDTDFDRWMTYLSRASLKKFTISMLECPWYYVPSSIYSLQELTCLDLNLCGLKPPPEINIGFKSLKCLCLESVDMKQLEFEQVISNCPSLESLSLLDFGNDFTSLKIHAPKLLSFLVDGGIDGLIFIDMFNLVDVRISLTDKSKDMINSGNLLHLFASLPRIQRLQLLEGFWKYFACGTIPEKLPTSCLDLTFLSIDINFKDIKEIMAVICLLRSSPNLKELRLSVRGFPLNEQDTTEDNNNMENLERFPLNELRLVTIDGITSSRQELNLIKLLLESAPVLESMSVRPRSKKKRWVLVKELLRFRRASTSAEIIYLG